MSEKSKKHNAIGIFELILLFISKRNQNNQKSNAKSKAFTKTNVNIFRNSKVGTSKLCE